MNSLAKQSGEPAAPLIASPVNSYLCAQLDYRHPISTLLRRGRGIGLDQWMMSQLFANGSPQRTCALAVNDAHRGHPRHGCVIQIRIQFLQSRLNAPAAHIE